MTSQLQVEVGVDTLETSDFKEWWAQYTKDMLSTCQAGQTEVMMCAVECQMRLAVYELQDSDTEGTAKMVMKHVPDGATHTPWVHVLRVISPTQGTTYFPTNIPPDFEPVWPADWGEF
jgi:hypothetical protein